MTALTDVERREACRALSAWFQSQDIMPPEASLIMVELMAICFVDKTKNVAELQSSIDIFKLGLVLNIALELKAKA